MENSTSNDLEDYELQFLLEHNSSQGYDVLSCSEEHKVIYRKFMTTGYVYYIDGKVYFTFKALDVLSRAHNVRYSIRDRVAHLIRIAPNPAAAIASAVEYIFGWNAPNWPLYGKFAKCFYEQEDSNVVNYKALTTFLLQFAHQQYTEDPIKHLLPLATHKSNLKTDKEKALERQMIDENVEKINALRQLKL